MDEVLLEEGGTYISPTRVVIQGVTYSVNGITSVSVARPFWIWGLALCTLSMTCCGLPSLGSLAALADPAADAPMGPVLLTISSFFVFMGLGILLILVKAVLISTSGLQKRALFTFDGGYADRVRSAVDLAITRRG